MPRSASAGASSRSATRFNAPRASPAARALAAAVIRESTGIPPNLSLPPFRCPALNLSCEHETPGYPESGTDGQGRIRGYRGNDNAVPDLYRQVDAQDPVFT